MGSLKSYNKFIWLWFCMIAVFCIIIVLMKAKDTFTGDEGGYYRIATNLSQGELPTVNWWGPGYPIILVPVIKFNIPIIFARLLNVFFLILAIIYIRRSLLIYLSQRNANIITIILGLYLPFYFHIHMLITEKFSLFLISAIVYHFLAIFKNNGIIHYIIFPILLAWLALTKVFYGYVILVLFILLICCQLLLKIRMWRIIGLIIISLLLCLPYLWHNYKLSGKIYYWATSGGLSLYWMTTPYDGETGTWFGPNDMHKYPLHKKHYEIFNQALNLNKLERDDYFKKMAMINIRKHKIKYIFNVFNNMLRLLFDFPYDFHYQTWKTSWVIIPNMFILPFFFLSFIPAWKMRKIVPIELWAIITFAIVSILGSSLLSAYNRMFTIIIPIVIVWTSFVWLKILKIEIITPDNNKSNYS